MASVRLTKQSVYLARAFISLGDVKVNVLVLYIRPRKSTLPLPLSNVSVILDFLIIHCNVCNIPSHPMPADFITERDLSHRSRTYLHWFRVVNIQQARLAAGALRAKPP